jgi:exopolysaccharide/PEP-CTERM locus tyrosine autokinase
MTADAINQADSEMTQEPVKKVAKRKRKICHLDLIKLKQAGYLTPGSDNKRLADEYRIIKRPLLHNAFGKGAAPVEKGNLIAITSAYSGEGKTFTSLNLALSIAMELDTTILLIDTDVIKMSLTKMLGLQNEPGLIDILQDRSKDPGDVILSTDIPGLKIIPAGSHHERPTELLASVNMRKITRELSERYSDRIIVFDAPPLLATTEASVVTHLMGQVMLVVEAGSTPDDAIKNAVAQLDTDKKVVGMILNKSRYSKGSGYDGGYYGSREDAVK